MLELGWDVRAIVDEAFARLTSNRKAGSAQNSIELLGSWIIAHRSDFIEQGAHGVEREVKGRWIDEDSKEARVAILTEPLRCLLEKHDLRYDSTLSHWRDRGWLDTEPDRLTKTVRIGGRKNKVVLLNTYGVEAAMGVMEDEPLPIVPPPPKQERYKPTDLSDLVQKVDW